MSNGIKYFVTFTLGAAVGSVAAWSFLKSRYERLAREEIEEVRDYYRQKDAEDKTEEDSAENSDSDKDKTEKVEYTNLVNNLYGNYDQEGGSESEFDDTPRVVSPEEFSACDEYQTETLTYYADGTLTDDFDNKIEDVEGMVGDGLDHFGEYGDDDVVHVINDRHKCAYEICKDVRTYDQARSRIMNLVDDD